jgi:glucose/arabinose dehydrogenase
MQVTGSVFIFLFSLNCFSQEILLRFTSENQKLKLEKVLRTNDIIWGFDFLPNGEIIFTKKSGTLKIFNPKTQKTTEVSGVPKTQAIGQGGLMDVVLHPNFKNNNIIYLTYTLADAGTYTTAMGRGVLKDNSLKDFKVLFKAKPALKGPLQFGSKIAFDDKGYLFLCVGDRYERDLAQKLDNDLGKILRFKDDGSIPNDNPFVSNREALPEIWSYGHRNPQGLVWNKKLKQLWESEHGPKGGDEINLIEPGKNYGWPVITWGVDYDGTKIGEPYHEGMEQPVKYYVPSIATSAITFYTGSKIKKWEDNIFVGALKLHHLNRVVLQNGKPVKEERLLENWNERIRNVRTGPDGWLYLSTDSGFLARITLQ